MNILVFSFSLLLPVHALGLAALEIIKRNGGLLSIISFSLVFATIAFTLVPPLVHNDFYSHMGPEPSYINDANGFLFENEPIKLQCCLEYVFSMPTESFLKISYQAYETYRYLNCPALAERMCSLLLEVCNAQG